LEKGIIKENIIHPFPTEKKRKEGNVCKTMPGYRRRKKKPPEFFLLTLVDFLLPIKIPSGIADENEDVIPSTLHCIPLFHSPKFKDFKITQSILIRRCHEPPRTSNVHPETKVIGVCKFTLSFHDIWISELGECCFTALISVVYFLFLSKIYEKRRQHFWSVEDEEVRLKSN